MNRLVLVLPLLLAACPTPAPVPPPSPDASDAASEAALATDCERACAAMQLAGCVVRPNCAAVLDANTRARRIRNPLTGGALTCAELAAAKTPADVNALGQGCGLSL
jgi:hypothetical protein